jgi:hypothetical protein
MVLTIGFLPWAGCFQKSVGPFKRKSDGRAAAYSFTNGFGQARNPNDFQWPGLANRFIGF